MRNYGTRTLHDIARGAVITFQFYDGHRGKIAVEVADNLDVRTTPAVNALVVITHHRHILVFVDQQLQQLVLHVVRVLVFVHDNILEAVRKLFSQVRHLLQHEYGVEQQIVKVHRVRFTQALLVFGIVTRAPFFVGELGTGKRNIGSLQHRRTILVKHRILVTRNRTMHALDFGGIAFIAQVFLQNLLQQTLLVVVIVNREIAIIPLPAKFPEHKVPIEAHLEHT